MTWKWQRKFQIALGTIVDILSNCFNKMKGREKKQIFKHFLRELEEEKEETKQKKNKNMFLQS